MDLPPLELDRSDTNVHGVLKPYQVDKLFKYIEYVQYTKYVDNEQYVDLIYILQIILNFAYSTYSAY